MMVSNVSTTATPLGTMNCTDQTFADPSRDIRTQLTDPSTYRKPEATKPRGEFSMPMGFHDVDHLEITNDGQVNVFQFSKVYLLPMYVSINRNIEPTMNLLLLFNEDVHHYVLINNFVKLVCTVKEKQFTNNLRLCRNKSYEEQHRVRDDACQNHAPATIKMPGDDQNSFRFKNFKARWFAPFTIYFDFESFLMPVSSCPVNPDASSTENIE